MAPPKRLYAEMFPETKMQFRAMSRIAVFSVLAAVALAFAAMAFAAAPVTGSVAPAFRLQDQKGDWHKLEDYRGKWLVLYFYPKDMTPGCTTQACEFRDNIFAFRDAGAVILGISVDDVESHKKFAEEHSLPFTILADPEKKTAADYGVLKKMYGMELAARETFLIDPQGKIAKYYPSVDPKGHSQLVLKDLKELSKAAG